MNCYLRITLVPRAKNNSIMGWHGDSLKIRLTAPPVDGMANDALVKFMAKTLKISNRNVELISGLTSRQKRIKINGLSELELKKRLAALVP